MRRRKRKFLITKKIPHSEILKQNDEKCSAFRFPKGKWRKSVPHSEIFCSVLSIISIIQFLKRQNNVPLLYSFVFDRILLFLLYCCTGLYNLITISGGNALEKKTKTFPVRLIDVFQFFILFIFLKENSWRVLTFPCDAWQFWIKFKYIESNFFYICVCWERKKASLYRPLKLVLKFQCLSFL